MSNTHGADFLSEIGLATKWDGAIVGFIVALLMLSGVLRIEIGLPQKAIIWFLLLMGIVVGAYNLKKGKSLFSAPVDGFIQGICLTYGLLNLFLGNIP